MSATISKKDMASRFPAWGMIKRELLTSLRAKRSVLILLSFMLLAVLVILNEWPNSEHIYGGIKAAGRVSRNMVVLLSGCMYIGCLLFVPAYSASAIVLERERSTYDLLRMSLISPLGVVFAKLFNAIGVFMVIILSMLPVMSTAFFLVGVEYTVVIQVFILTICAVLTCACIGLACSSILRKSITSIVVTYLSVLLFLIGPLLFAYLFAVAMATFSYSRSLFRVVENIGEGTSPIWVMANVLDRGVQLGDFVTCLLYHGIVVFVCLGVAYWKIKKPPEPAKISQEKPIDDVKVLKDRRMGFPFYILDPLKRKKPIEDSRNPMMVRELRWGLLNRGTTLVRVFYVAFLIYFLAGAIASIDGRSHESMKNWFGIQIVLTVLAAPGLIANSLTKEYELGNLDILRMTLLKPREIILGKYTAGLGALSPMLLAAVFSIIPIIFLGMFNYGAALVGYGTLLVCSLLSISIGLFSSLVTKQTTISIMISYMISIVLYLGIALVLAWFNPLWLGNDDYAMYLSPLLVLEMVLYPRYSSNILYVEWLWAMCAWLLVSAVFLRVSLFLFYRNKMQDR